MGYQALLFCSDEKTVRLVTQVLTELDFTVEPANEPFAAVKRLTTQHFDAVVVDCENEQNSALLFKTARNSGPNRTSLAVAVVEGQPGIAKAFRIGANLVLTKPINVEQSKGTLRVARGLLKKSDAGKPAAAPTAVAPGAPSIAARSLTPVPPASRPVVPPRSLTTPPAPVVRAEAASSLELDQDPVPQPEPADAALLESMPEPATPPVPRSAVPRLTPKPAPWAPPKSAPSAGTAAGAAPAREISALRADPIAASTAAIGDALPKRTEATSKVVQRAEVPPAPLFSASRAQESGGGSKGLIIGLVVVILAAAGYFGWTKLHSPAATPSVESASTQSTAKPAASVAASATPAQPAAATPETVAPSAPRATAPPVEDEPEVVQKTVAPAPKPTHESITVKSSVPKSNAAEAPQVAPVIGMAPSGNDKAISGLIASGTPARTPILRTMKVSQGVSQGLIIKRVAPDYPMQARQLRIEGAVQLEATINKEGNVSNVKVLGGHPILARAATDAIKQWKYKPYMLNSVPVEIETQITINFKLP